MLFGDLLIFSCDGSDDAFVVALDKRTGKVRLEDRDGARRSIRRTPLRSRFASAIATTTRQRRRLPRGRLRSANGKEIWRVSYRDGFSNVPRPVFGHGLVFIATGFQEPSLLAVRADGSRGRHEDASGLVARSRAAPLTPSPLLVGNELYIVNDVGIATCLDARTGTGLLAAAIERRISRRRRSTPRGRIYFLSEEGVATVTRSGNASFQKLAVEHARRLDAGLDRGIRRLVLLHSQRQQSLPCCGMRK